jgi:hypothetical protein
MKRLFLSLFALTAALTTLGAGEDDFGVWGEFTMEKEFNYNWSAGIESHFRTEKNSSCLDRWGVGLNAKYKVNKYLKFGVGIELLNDYTRSKIKNWSNAGWDIDTDEGIAIRQTGYRKTNSYFTPKFRFKFDILAGMKIGQWLRISLRERYRYARVGSVNVMRTKHRKTDVYTATDINNWQWALSDAGEWTSEMTDPKVEDAYSNHQLRSRLKVEMDKKRNPWHPFVSGEMFNNMSDGMDIYKIRASAGCGYDFNKHHSLSFAYIITFYHREIENDYGERLHATSISYDIKF